MPRQTVESIKADLLKVPVSAYARAHHAYQTLKQDPHQDNDQIALWLSVVDSLRADGYAPDSSTGAPGPATTAHYESQVLGRSLPEDEARQAVYEKSGIPANILVPGTHAFLEPPDPYIE